MNRLFDFIEDHPYAAGTVAVVSSVCFTFTIAVVVGAGFKLGFGG